MDSSLLCDILCVLLFATKKTPKCGGLKKQQFVIAHDAEVEQSGSSPLAQVTCVVHSAGSL